MYNPPKIITKYNNPYSIPIKKQNDSDLQSIISIALQGNYSAIHQKLIENNTTLFFTTSDKKNITSFILSNTKLSNDEKYKLIKLLKLHGTPLDLPDEKYVRPLHLACAQQNYKLIKLLCKCKADPNSRDVNFRTPIHYLMSPLFTKCKSRRKIKKDDDENNNFVTDYDRIQKKIIDNMVGNNMVGNNTLFDIFRKIYSYIGDKCTKFNESDYECDKIKNRIDIQKIKNKFIKEKIATFTNITMLNQNIDEGDNDYNVVIDNDIKSIEDSRFDIYTKYQNQLHKLKKILQKLDEHYRDIYYVFLYYIINNCDYSDTYEYIAIQNIASNIHIQNNILKDARIRNQIHDGTLNLIYDIQNLNGYGHMSLLQLLCDGNGYLMHYIDELTEADNDCDNDEYKYMVDNLLMASTYMNFCDALYNKYFNKFFLIINNINCEYKDGEYVHSTGYILYFYSSSGVMKYRYEDNNGNFNEEGTLKKITHIIKNYKEIINNIRSEMEKIAITISLYMEKCNIFNYIHHMKSNNVVNMKEYKDINTHNIKSRFNENFTVINKYINSNNYDIESIINIIINGNVHTEQHNEHTVDKLNYYFKYAKIMMMNIIGYDKKCEDIQNDITDEILNDTLKKLINLAITNCIEGYGKILRYNMYKNLFTYKSFMDINNDDNVTDYILNQYNKSFGKEQVRERGLQYMIGELELLKSDSENIKLVPFDSFDNVDSELCAKIDGKCIALLIKHGANPNSMEKFGDTPLNLAIHIRDKYIIEMLLGSGANVVIKVNGVIKNIYESGMHLFDAISDKRPSSSLYDYDNKIKNSLAEKLDNNVQYFVNSKYVLKMAMYLFNHQLTQYSDNYPYMWTDEEHKLLTRLLNIDPKNKNMTTPFGEITRLDEDLSKNKVIDEYIHKINKVADIIRRLQIALNTINDNYNDDYNKKIENDINVSITNYSTKIDKYKKELSDLLDKKSMDKDNIKHLKDKYKEKYDQYQNNVCCYYEEFFKNIDINSNDISSYLIYINAWKDILSRRDKDVSDYTQLVSKLERYISKNNYISHDKFTKLYGPIVSFYDKILSRYARDFFELSIYYNKADSKSNYVYGHNYALTQITCIMIHVVRHTLCFDFTATVANKIMKVLIHKGKHNVIKQLYRKLKDFFKKSFEYIPEKMVKVVCGIYESDNDPDNKLSKRDILEAVFEYINKSGRDIVIDEKIFKKIKNDTISMFVIYMEEYIREMYKIFVLQLRTYTEQSKLLNIIMMLAEKATAELESHRHIM